MCRQHPLPLQALQLALLLLGLHGARAHGDGVATAEAWWFVLLCTLMGMALVLSVLWGFQLHSARGLQRQLLSIKGELDATCPLEATPRTQPDGTDMDQLWATNKFVVGNLDSPVQTVLKCIQSVQLISDIRTLHKQISVHVDTNPMHAVSWLLCSCCNAQAAHDAYNDAVVLEEELLGHMLGLLVNSNNYFTPDFRAEIENGNILIEDEATKDWLVHELGAEHTAAAGMSMLQKSGGKLAATAVSPQLRAHARLMSLRLTSQRKSGKKPLPPRTTQSQTSTRGSLRQRMASLIDRSDTASGDGTSDSTELPRATHSLNINVVPHSRNDSVSVRSGGLGSVVVGGFGSGLGAVGTSSPLGSPAAGSTSGRQSIDSNTSRTSRTSPVHSARSLNIPIPRHHSMPTDEPSPIAARMRSRSTFSTNDIARVMEMERTSSYVRFNMQPTAAELELSEDAQEEIHRKLMDSERGLFQVQEVVSKTFRVNDQVIIVRDAVLNWDCRIFEIADALDGEPLPVVGFALMERHGLIKALNLDVDVLKRALVTISAGYHSENTFHNSIHGSDVAHSLSHFVHATRLQEHLPPYEVFCLIVAALIHDFDHPGVNNNFLVHTTHPLAARYNDRAVLENHHVSAALSLLSMRESTDLLGCLPGTTRKICRSLIIQLVLATDLAENFAIISNFKRRFHAPILNSKGSTVNLQASGKGLHKTSNSASSGVPAPSPTPLTKKHRFGSYSSWHRSMTERDQGIAVDVKDDLPGVVQVAAHPADAKRSPLMDSPNLSTKKQKPHAVVGGLTAEDLQEAGDRLLVLKMAIKCADLGHPAKSWHNHLEWTQRVSEEFYCQGASEAALGLSISPFMDRSKHHQLAKQQLGFFDFLVLPMWKTFLRLFPSNLLRECKQNLSANRGQWETHAESDWTPLTWAAYKAQIGRKK